MNSYIERISLCSLVIFILIICHFEIVNSKPIVFASSSLLNYDTENFIDNEENTTTSYSEIDYVSNTKNSIETNSTNSPNNTVEEKETKLLAESNAVSVSKNTEAYNENQQTSYDKIEPGPNNNNQFEENSIELAKSNNAVEIEAPTAEITTEKEINVVSKVAEITAQFAKPPLPPGGGGEDPFAVPIDDFYGFFLVLGASIIFGVVRLRKLKLLNSTL